jgi:hypothetical protein
VRITKATHRTDLQASVTKAADFTGANLGDMDQYRELVITFNVISAERDSADETYDVYITTTDGVGAWDLVHFPQIAATGAKEYTARVLAGLLPQNVTTAGPGVAAVDSATLKVDTAGADEGIKTLAAGSVRHGPWASAIGHELVVAGTVVTGINYSIRIEAR